MKLLLAALFFSCILVSCDKKDPEPISTVVQFKTTPITGTWICDSIITTSYDSTHFAGFINRTKYYNNSKLLKFISDNEMEEGGLYNNKYGVNAAGTYSLKDKTLIINIKKTDLLYSATYYTNKVTENSLIFSDTVFYNGGDYTVTVIKANK